MKCLVIEDDTETAHYVCSSLRDSGHDIVHSADGRDGLEQALNGVWDMVILDRMLPGGLDGLTIVERMRALSPMPITEPPAEYLPWLAGAQEA